MVILTREQAAKAEHFNIVEVDVSEWGNVDPQTGKNEKTVVFVREMSARERDEWEASLTVEKRGKRKFNFVDARARLAVLVCCDENRCPIFKPEDVEWLTTKSVRPLSRIFNAAQELNGITDEDEEELVKN